MRSDPHLIKHTESLEKVQKFALKVCTKSWNSTYSSLSSQMDLPRLDQRRVQLKLFFNSFIKILSSCTCLFHNVPVIVNVRNNNPLLLSIDLSVALTPIIIHFTPMPFLWGMTFPMKIKLSRISRFESHTIYESFFRHATPTYTIGYN